MFEIGATLREARERRQLTYEQVEAETKIRAKYLRALEEEEFDSLPSGTYVRGFLRAYASYLGLDGRLFVDEYASRFGTRHDDELFRRRRERPMTQRRESSSAVLVALIAVVAIGVLFFVAWRFGPGEANTPSPTVHGDRDDDHDGGAQQERLDRAPGRRDHGDDDAAPRHHEGAGDAARRRVDVDHLGQGQAPLDGQDDRRAGRRSRSAPGRRRAPDDYGFAIETAIPGNLARRQRPRLRDRGKGAVARHGRHGRPARRAGQDPACAGRPRGSDGRKADGRAARDRSGAAARTRRGRQHALPRPRARRARDRSAPCRHRRRRRTTRSSRDCASSPVTISSSRSGGLGPTHDDRTVAAVAEAAGAELALDEHAARHDRGDHGRVRAPARRRSRAQPRRRPQAGARAARRDRDPAGGHRARAAAAVRSRPPARAAGPATRARGRLGARARDPRR